MFECLFALHCGMLDPATRVRDCNDLLILNMFRAFSLRIYVSTLPLAVYCMTTILIATARPERVECRGVHILSTGGTAAKLRDLGCTVQALGFRVISN